MRVKIIKEYAQKHFPKTPVLDFALAVEQVTTKKKATLILNVDGCIAACFVDLLRDCGAFDKTEADGNNAFFVTSGDANLIPFQPDPEDSIFYDWRIRESRDSDGQLNFLSGFLRQSAMSKMPLIDLKTNQIISVEEVN
jgi:hypothetical protein